MTQATRAPLLEVRDLAVEFATRRGTVRAVAHVDISVAKGETLAIVGESGSGKSVTSYAVMRILDRAGRIAQGAVRFSGINLSEASERDMRDLRGRESSMIFQNPRAALNVGAVTTPTEPAVLAAPGVGTEKNRRAVGSESSTPYDTSGVCAGNVGA